MSATIKEYSTKERIMTAHIRSRSKVDMDIALKNYFLDYPREGYGTMIEVQPKYDFVNLEWTTVLSRLQSCD